MDEIVVGLGVTDLLDYSCDALKKARFIMTSLNLNLHINLIVMRHKCVMLYFTRKLTM